jgi:DNA replication protein DnaC
MSGSLKDIMDKLEQHIKERQEEWDTLPEEEKKRIFDEEHRKDELRQREELIASYKDKGITPKFYDEYWNTWIADTEDKKRAFKTVKEKAWKTNLFLCGKSGTGKTHLAMSLTKDGAKYRRLPDIFREVRMNFSTEQDVINRYGTTKFLIIDEVGRQKFTPFEKDLFFEIVDKRWNYELPTTLITNQDEKEFMKEYGSAILDRLRPTIVRFNWESRREKLNLPEKAEPEKQEDDIDF